MDKIEYQNIFDHEGSHFFYVSTHSLITALVHKFKRRHLQRPLEILDAGCGTGLLAKQLKQLGNVSAFDISHEAIRFSRKRGVRVKLGSINKIPFRSKSFDVVTCVDVIYHKLVNERGAAREIWRVLRPGGILVIRVAANSWLKLNHDRLVHGAKRFDAEELRSLLEKQGFEIKRLTYVHAILFPIVVFKHYWESWFDKNGRSSSIGNTSEWINKIFIWLLKLENKLIVRFNLPFGVGLVAVAKKTVI